MSNVSLLSHIAQCGNALRQGTAAPLGDRRQLRAGSRAFAKNSPCKKRGKKKYIYHSFARSDQPGWGTITGDRESKHLLLNASRLQCDMFAVLSSSDVWPTVIHFKHLACVALSLLLTFTLSLSFLSFQSQLS